MITGLADYLMAAAIILVLPLYGLLEFRQVKRWNAGGVPDARLRGYRLTIAVEWAFVLAILAIWANADRSWTDLGLAVGGSWRFWTGCGLVVVAGVLMILQTVGILRNPQKIQSTREELEEMQDMLPRDGNEARWWSALSVTAGICEEVIFRAFLLAFLSAFWNTWVALGLTSVIFGIVHAYQGLAGVFKTGIFGLVMAGLYVLSGSLLVPVVVHIMMDLNAGYLGRKIFELTDMGQDPAAE